MNHLSGVCIFTETYYPVVGGGESQARVLAESLKANGIKVDVVTRRSHASLKKKEKFGTITVHRLPPAGGEHYKKWAMIFTSFPILIKLRRNYDLVFVSGFRVLGITAVLVSRILGRVCVLKADSLGEMSGDFFRAGLAKLGASPSSFLFRSFLWLRDKILKRADSFVAVSSEVASELICYGVNPNMIRMIPNSVDTCRFYPVNSREKQELRRKLGLSAKDTIVIFTGRLVSYKGLPLLLRVWQDIQAKHHNISLLLVGSGGLDIHNCESELKKFVVENDLQESVHFTGDVHNVHEYLQASDIFVFPTEREAFGISLVEAMACGLPVIATAAGGIKDILTHQHNGLVVEAGDFQGLYAALEYLLTDTALAVRLGKTARQSVQESYSVQIVARKYVNLFQSITDQDHKALV
jgi:glycosyltransferase involved in cell wall biosynthesis